LTTGLPEAGVPRYIGIDIYLRDAADRPSEELFFDVASRIFYLAGDAQALPLRDACCDVVSIAFAFAMCRIRWRHYGSFGASSGRAAGDRAGVFRAHESAGARNDNFLLLEDHALDRDVDQPGQERRVPNICRTRRDVSDARTDVGKTREAGFGNIVAGR